MKKAAMLLAMALLMGACASSNEKTNEEANATEANNVTAEKDDSTETEVEQAVEEEEEKEQKENADVDFSDASIPKTEIPNVYFEDGNFKQHTMQEYVEMAKEQGIVRFAMDDFPVRGIKNENVTNVTNLGDSYIDITENVAYQVVKEQIPIVYNLFLTSQPEDLKGTPDSEYRTWEEASNLERGIMQIVFLTAPSLNDLGYIIENDEFDHPVLKIVQTDFFDLGAPTVLMPAPQTATDMVMYDIMLQMQSLWEQVGKFENPAENKAEFEKLYKELRSETNNLLVRINYVLTE